MELSGPTTVCTVVIAAVVTRAVAYQSAIVPRNNEPDWGTLGHGTFHII